MYYKSYLFTSLPVAVSAQTKTAALDSFIYMLDKLDSTELSRVVGVISMYLYPPTCL